MTSIIIPKALAEAFWGITRSSEPCHPAQVLQGDLRCVTVISETVRTDVLRGAEKCCHSEAKAEIALSKEAGSPACLLGGDDICTGFSGWREVDAEG